MTRDNDTERNKHGGSQTARLEKSIGCSGDPGAASEPPGAGDTMAAGVFRTKYPRGDTCTGSPGFRWETRVPLRVQLKTLCTGGLGKSHPTGLEGTASEMHPGWEPCLLRQHNWKIPGVWDTGNSTQEGLASVVGNSPTLLFPTLNAALLPPNKS